MLKTSILILLLFAGVCSAQPVVGAAVNTASFASPELPNGSLAQGSMFAVFGSNMGPATLEIISAFPLPTDLGGTSVQVTVGGTAVDCIMIFTLSAQLAAILPSNTPLGDGTLTVAFNGQTSPPLPIRVVSHSFGIFAINQGGSGPGVFTDNPDFVSNTLVHAATPGSVWTVWGTGLGPVAGDEAGGQLPGDMTDLDVSVLVGGKPATIFYRGRSGCCAGIDQIAFAIPDGVNGCYVPVVVVVEGVASNFTTISVTETGSTCSNIGGGFTAAELDAARMNGNISIGNIALSRSRLSITGPFPSQSFEFVTDTASAMFGNFDLQPLLASQGVAGISTFGACTVFQFQGSDPQLMDPVLPTPLDAGPSLMLSGPRGTAQLQGQGEGVYTAQLSGSLPSFLTAALKGVEWTPVSQSLPGFLEPGQYSVTGPGGSDVGPFTATLEIPEALAWTNRDDITSIQRSRNLTVTWTGGGNGQFVQIFGFSAASVQGDEFSGALFFCRERISAGSFSIPAVVLSSLPASVTESGIPTGLLGAGTNSNGTRFNASGLDVGVLFHSDLTLKTVGYE